MILFFDFCIGLWGGVQIQATNPRDYDLIEPLLFPTSKIRIPDRVNFQVVRGKRWTDIIEYYEDRRLCFYSQKLIDVLDTFMDMTDKCYPIQIEGIDKIYYVIYNLKEYPFLNQNYSAMFQKPSYFKLSDEYPPLFTLSKSNLRVCTAAVKDALAKAKISNIRIREKTYGLNEEEYNEYMAHQYHKEIGLYDKFMRGELDISQLDKELDK